MVQKDIIHLVGGQDEFQNNLDTVDEFNIKDMRVFQADWRLPKNLSSFGKDQGDNVVFIAGGMTRDPISNETNICHDVFSISFQKSTRYLKEVNKALNLTELGSYPGSEYKYMMRKLPPLVTAR
jgi:hypothetical protein